MSDRDNWTVYNSFQLRSQWENRAKQFSKKGEEEIERQGKSALNGLYKKWQSHLENKNGTAKPVETTGKGNDLSDFRRIVVIKDTDVDNDRARFKVVPPPQIPRTPPLPCTLTKSKTPKRAKHRVFKPSGGWDESWKCLKPPEQEIKSDEKWWRDFKQDRYLPFSEWARPFRCKPLLLSNILHQQTEYWQLIWTVFKWEQKHTGLKAKTMEDKVNFQEWQDAWKTSKSLRKKYTKNQIDPETRMPKVFLPGWTESWKVANHNFPNSCQWLQDWPESWKFCPEHDCFKTTKNSQMSKHMLSNELWFSLEILNVSQWMESWKSVKPQPQSQESHSDTEDTGSVGNMPIVPLHLQFHKLNTEYPNWHRSWKVSTADNEANKWGWKWSWKICIQDLNDKKAQRDVVFFSTKHKTQRCLEVDRVVPTAWHESWKITKPPQCTETQEEESYDKEVAEDSHKDTYEDCMVVPWSYWAVSWKFKPGNVSSYPPTQPTSLIIQQKQQPRTPSFWTYKDNVTQSSWGDSWESLKPLQKQVQTQGRFWRSFNQDRDLSLDQWAKPFKCRPLLFSQLLHRQTIKWHQVWSTFNWRQSNLVLHFKLLGDEIHISEWKKAWMTRRHFPNKHTEKHMIIHTIKPKVFLPGWIDSWKMAGNNVQNSYPCLKDWLVSWKFCQDQHSFTAFTDIQYLQHFPVLPKLKLSSELLSSKLNKMISSLPEWIESWKSVKSQPNLQSEPGNNEFDINVSYVPLPIQFHKGHNTSFASWCESWKLSNAENEREQERKWKHSWKISQNEIDVFFLSIERKAHSFLGVEHSKNPTTQNEWSESWRTKQQKQQMVDWAGSWRVCTDTKSKEFVSITQWRHSWRLSTSV